MSSIVSGLDSWYLGLGVVGGLILFAVGVLADETLRGVYHWVFDRRLTHLWRKLRLRRTTEIPMEVRQSFAMDMPETATSSKRSSLFDS